MKLDYNFHSHTTRCGHAGGLDEHYVQSAILAGFKHMGFSDHAYILNYEEKGTRMNQSLFPDYLESVHHLQEKYKDQIDIKIGLEAEYIPMMIDEYKRLLTSDTLDYLIVGQHMHLISPTDVTSYFRLGDEKGLILYIDDLIKAIDSQVFTYIAHPDLFAYFYQRSDDTLAYHIRRLLDKVKEKDMIIELNISKLANNIRLGRDMFYNAAFPNFMFWDLAGEYGVKVALGLDAHDPHAYLDSPIEWAKEFIKEKHLNVLTQEEIKARMLEIKTNLKQKAE